MVSSHVDLFMCRFADKVDRALVIVGFFCACAKGSAERILFSMPMYFSLHCLLPASETLGSTISPKPAVRNHQSSLAHFSKALSDTSTDFLYADSQLDALLWLQALCYPSLLSSLASELSITSVCFPAMLLMTA